MQGQTRKTGLSVIDDVPWGTHLCQFYDTKQDLLDILVPYFKAGLENNELCIWATSYPLDGKEAEEAMRKAVPNFAQYLETEQISIVPHTEWYLRDGAFNQQGVLSAWLDKLNQALSNGYEGMRVSGNTAWLEERDWGNFIEYEEAVNNAVGKHQMLAICTYPADRCKVSQIIDVMANHQLALFKRAGEWAMSKPRGGEKMTSQGISGRRLALLQKRFSRSGFKGLSDRRIIELLLSLSLPYQESRSLAKECLEEFKDLSGFLAASPEELERVGVTPPCMFCIKLLHELPAEILKKKIIEQSFYKSSKEVFDYLYYSMRDLKTEVLKIIFLDSRNQIIETVDLFEGTLESIPIRPREIVGAAIMRGAASIIFVHNHPSGDPAPSKSDKQFTRDLVFIGSIIQIKVLDHIIIGGNRYFSFADEGLIRKYELDFLNFKIRSVFDGGVGYPQIAKKN